MPGRPSFSVIALAGFALVCAAALAHVGLRNFLWQPDETLFVQISRYVGDHFPAALFQGGVYERGPQRLTVWQLTLLQWLFHAPTALQLARVLQAALYVSVAVPTFLLARGVGLSRPEAAVPAALAIVVPWAVVGTTFLTEPIAYPLAAFLLLAVWRAATAPSPRRDALSLVALGLAILAKTSLAALAPIVMIVPIAQAARYPAETGRGWWSSVWARLWSDHRLLLLTTTIVLAAAALWTAVQSGTGSSPLGIYSTLSGGDLHAVSHQTQILLSRLVVGTGIIPACLALPWLARTLIRPDDPRDHALALVAVASTVALVVATAFVWGDDRGGIDERYVMYLAVPIFVVASRAVVTWSVGVVGVAIASTAVALLIAETSWQVDTTFGVRSLAYPAEAFFGRVVVGRLAMYEPNRLIGHEPAVAAIAAAVAAVALVALGRWAARRGRGPLLAGVAAACVAIVQVVQTGYNLDNWNKAQGASPPGWGERAWVDVHNRAGDPVAILAIGYTDLGDYASIWDEVRFHNATIGPVVKERGGLAPEPPTATKTFVKIRPSDGLVTSSRPLPRLAVTGHDFRTVGLTLHTVADAVYLDARLVVLPPRLHADWMALDGTYPDGFLLPAGRARLRVYTAGLPAGQRTCLRIGAGGTAGLRGSVGLSSHRRQADAHRPGPRAADEHNQGRAGQGHRHGPLPRSADRGPSQRSVSGQPEGRPARHAGVARRLLSAGSAAEPAPRAKRPRDAPRQRLMHGPQAGADLLELAEQLGVVRAQLRLDRLQVRDVAARAIALCCELLGQAPQLAQLLEPRAGLGLAAERDPPGKGRERTRARDGHRVALRVRVAREDLPHADVVEVMQEPLGDLRIIENGRGEPVVLAAQLDVCEARGQRGAQLLGDVLVHVMGVARRVDVAVR